MTFNRRGSSLTVLVCVGVVIIVGGYSYYYINELSSQLKRKDREVFVSREHERTLKDQLKVVYQHTTKLEEALRRERESHKDTKTELLNKNQDFVVNLTKARHVAMNRFNALDTDFKMLKASCEEANQNHLALQQNYARLSQDHKQLADGCKRDYKRLKDASESESISLQSRVQELFNQKVHFQKQAESYAEEYTKTMNNLQVCQYRLNVSSGATNKLQSGEVNTGNISNHKDDHQTESILQKRDLRDQHVTDQELTAVSSQHNNGNGFQRVFNGIENSMGSNIQRGNADGKINVLNKEVPNEMRVRNELSHDLDQNVGKDVYGRYIHVIDRKDKSSVKYADDKNERYKQTVDESPNVYKGDAKNGRYENSVPDIVLQNGEKNNEFDTKFNNQHGRYGRQDGPILGQDNVKFQPIRGAGESHFPSQKLEKPIENNIKFQPIIGVGETQSQSQILENPIKNNIKYQPIIGANQLRSEVFESPANNENHENRPKNPVLIPELKYPANVEEIPSDRNANNNQLLPVVPMKNAVEAVFNDNVDKLPAADTRRLEAQNERMNVKKVTLEDDENGDQNLDHDVSLVKDDAVNGPNVDEGGGGGGGGDDE